MVKVPTEAWWTRSWDTLVGAMYVDRQGRTDNCARKGRLENTGSTGETIGNSGNIRERKSP